MSHFFARCANRKRVRFLHGRVFFGSRNVQKRATKSDNSGHCLALGGSRRLLQGRVIFDKRCKVKVAREVLAASSYDGMDILDCLNSKKCIQEVFRKHTDNKSQRDE